MNLTPTPFIQKLSNYNDASYSALWVQTFEEERITNEIINGLYRKGTGKDDPGRQIYSWDSQNGLVDRSDNVVKKIAKTEDPIDLFSYIKGLTTTGTEKIFILKDFHLQFSKPIRNIEYIRAFKNITAALKASRNLVLFVSPVIKIPTELTKEIQLIDFHLPSEEDIRQRLHYIRDNLNQGVKVKDQLELTTEIEELTINAAKGMTNAEVENAFALAIVENKKFNVSFVKSVFAEKVQQIKKGGMLTYIDSDISFDKVGGLGGVKDWIKLRKHGFSKEARTYKLPFPKGIGLAGVPGCGKTLISKAIANEFKFPLYQLDLGSLFSKFVGETEGNFIQMTKTIESIGRCVILIDEIEKYLNSGATSGTGDTGTSSRSFGTLLSWMSDRTSPAFIIFTSNNHLILPPELIRKGRFDELFWVDLPDDTERNDIVNVVLKKYDRDPSIFDIPALVLSSKDFTGAEIDTAFTDAMFNAFSKGREVESADFVAELKNITPQSKINEDKISSMRDQIEGKMRRANKTQLVSYMEQKRKVRV